jgi:hypothetical protein
MNSSPIDISGVRRPLPSKVTTTGWILVIAGIGIYLLGYSVNPKEAAFTNLINFLFLTSISVGSIFLIALEYIAGAVWSVPMRRVSEFLAALVPVAVVLALPALGHLHNLFRWTSAGVAAADPAVQAKQSYLSINFFLLRFAVIFAVWVLFYFFLTRNSLKQDSTRDQKLTHRNVRLSGAFMPILAITVTIAAIDWAMSLEPDWYSTVFGVYYFAGMVLAGLSAATYIIVRLHEAGYMPNLRRDHFYSLGALMFAFVNFWAYIAFSQFMLMWYANLPEETFWFIMRWKNGWQYVSVLLLIAQFWGPFFMLLTQDAKMDLKRLKLMSIWLLLAHLLDLYWLVMPTYAPGVAISWTLIAIPALTTGLIILVLSWKMRRHNLVPIGDPKLQRGLDFRLGYSNYIYTKT